jgi:hypothetical protein
MDPRGIADAADEAARFGPWVENACLAHAWNAAEVPAITWQEFLLDGPPGRRETAPTGGRGA